jgi:peptidoglycan L-alanyl-D-glutamate endopeptidase CwlK
MTQNLHFERLNGVHPDLYAVVLRAAEICPIKFMVVEGIRSDTQAYLNYGKGRTSTELAAKGVPTKYAQPALSKVTWLNNPLSTTHRKQPDGFGHAVDLLPAPFDWAKTGPFDIVAEAMFQAAKELNVKIRWGADWDNDGKFRERGESDSPHFELDR